MLRVPIKEVRPGMKLALPLYNPASPGQPLLRPDFELNPDLVKRMIELDIRDIWVRQPGMEAVMEYVDVKLIRDRANVAQSIRDAFSISQQQSTPKLDFDTYTAKLSDMIEQMLEHPTSMLYLDDLSQTDQPLMDHCMRVTYLAVLVGMKLDAYLIQQRKRLNAWHAQQVTNLGLGAMLHDIGYTQLDKQVVERHEQNRDETDAAWQKHVQLGFDLLAGNLDPSARTCALHHHQHFDGTGFPTKEQFDGSTRPLRGEQIHIFPRIVTVADVFDRLQYPRPGKRLPPVVALQQMLMTDRRNWFDPVVLQTFMRIAPAYPPGTQVELSNGLLGGAIDHSPDDPCRPTIQLFRKDDEQAKGEGELIDLRKQRDLWIVKADGLNVTDFNFTPPNLAELAVC